MPLFAADEDDSAFDIVDGVQYSKDILDQFTRLSRDLIRRATNALSLNGQAPVSVG